MMESRSCSIGRRRHVGLNYSAAATLLVSLLATSALAQDTIVSNIELCNGRDRSSPEPQIRGCSEVIKASPGNIKMLAVAYNNRGNAYNGEGQYDLALEDYNKAI